MNENIKLTENEVINKLVAKAKSLKEASPRVIVVHREQSDRGSRRLVRFALIATNNNESLIDGLIQECLDNNNEFYFVGSDVNLQHDLEVDYLFFEAKIYSKK